MKIISQNNFYENENLENIGNKAKNLFILQKLAQEKRLNYHIPPFVVITDFTESDILDISQEFIQKVISNLPKNTGTNPYFAVRSSSTEEDSEKLSFAGIFESYLYVNAENLAKKIQKVANSAQSPRAEAYRKAHNLADNADNANNKNFPAVIVQIMIDADTSGVAFGANILNNNPDEMLINSVFGVGEGVVSGELDADLFIIKNFKNLSQKPNQKIDVISQIAQKTHKITLDNTQKHHTQKTEIPIQEQNIASLPPHHIENLTNILIFLENHYKNPQDIEFCIKNDELYLLQTRNITNFIPKKDQKNESNNYIIWDNSNIVESYPNITTPLTFSFISKAYQRAYTIFAGFLGVNDKVIKENEQIFANTLGFLNGRVYYNLKSWYQMLAMLPSYRINARFMEKMMGVKERFDVPESLKMSKFTAWWQILKMGVNMLWKFRNLPKIRKNFTNLVEKTISNYKNIDFETKTAHQIMELYLNFEKILLNEWKAPLLNDFFAMIYFGRLQKLCEKHQFHLQNPNIHNDLLCGSQDIISTQPIHKTIALAEFIQENDVLKNIFEQKNETEIWEILIEKKIFFENENQEIKNIKNEKIKNLKQKIDEYLALFGERCVGELKLESISYTQEPTLFIKILKNYVLQKISSKKYNQNTENHIRQTAEQQVNEALKGNFWTNIWKNLWKKRAFFQTLQKTRDLVSQRENLRYERTRAYGMVRKMFYHLGKRFCEQNIILNERDIFYLTKEEIFAQIAGTAVTQDLKALITLRKKEFENYANDKQTSERFATYDIVYANNDFFDTTKNIEIFSSENKNSENQNFILKGIGCCMGVVKSKVSVLKSPHEIDSLKGNILVTHSTDPAWVVLFPDAGGILVERGSLLSHSAIVAREMGKPCIVGITGLLKTLKNDMVVEMNGSSGIINFYK